MSLTAANAAIQILATATKTLNAARERAQTSNDTNLKALINTLYDQMASLKEAVHRVVEENSERNQVRAAEPEIRQVGAVNYYFVGEKGPFCQPCYDGKQKLVALSPTQESNSGVYRRCALCKEHFWEKPEDLSAAFGVAGPDGWMGR